MTPEKFQSDGVLVQLISKQWEGRTKLEKSQLRGVPKEIIRGRQELLVDREPLKEITAIKRKAKSLLEFYALPFPLDSVYWVKRDVISVIDDELKEIKEEYDNEVDYFIDVFNSQRLAFKREYPDYYRPEKYPSAEELRSRFLLDWRYFQISLPDKGLGLLSATQYKRETEKLRGIVKEMEDMAVNMIGNMLYKRIMRLGEQCNNDNGRINKATVESLEKFFYKWDDLWEGHVDQKQLQNVMDGLRKNMKGVDLESLKDNEDIRTKLGSAIEVAMEDIKAIPDFRLQPRFDI